MRIAGITIPDNKHLDIALTSIYGVGRPRAQEILKQAGVDAARLPSELSEEEEGKIRALVEEYKIEGDLKRETSSNIKRLKDIKAYRGSRHAKNLPANGQRTKTNSRSVRGNARKTMGSGRRKVEKK